MYYARFSARMQAALHLSHVVDDHGSREEDCRFDAVAQEVASDARAD